MIYDYPEVDANGRENALSGIKRAGRTAYEHVFSVSDEDRVAVRQAQAVKRPRPPSFPPPPSSSAE